MTKPKNTSSNINCYQINLHNALQANTELLNSIRSSSQPFIALIQEPYLYKKKVAYPASCTKLEHPKSPRTAIYISDALNFSSIDSLCNTYATVIAGRIHGQKLLICSIYLHHKQDATPSWLTEIITYAKTNTFGLLISADANAHSSMWGPTPKHRDPRGEKLEEYIIKHSLKVENIGTLPTFRNSRDYTSTIDFTLSYNLKQPLKHWMVHDKTQNYSDHNTITFTLTGNPNTVQMIRPWHKCDWDSFTNDLANLKYDIPTLTTQISLDKSTTELHNIIDKYLDKHCKKRPLKSPNTINHWYTDSLKKQRHQVSKAYTKWKANPMSQTLEQNYKSLNKEYKKQCRKTKKKMSLKK